MRPSWNKNWHCSDDHRNSTSLRRKMNEINTAPPPENLPDELIFEEILPRLPVKSLLRFKSVSKSWHSKITSPKFTNLHLQFSFSRPQLLFIYEKATGGDRHLFKLPYNETNFSVEQEWVEFRFEFEFEFEDAFEYRDILSSCNGLVLLHEYQDPKNLFIWNPATHYHRTIKIPKDEHKVMTSLCDIYYKSSDDEYNIFGSFSWYNDFNGVVHFYVFSLKSGTWKRIGNENEEDKRFELSGVLHSILINDTIYILFLNHIARFDIATEELRDSPLMDWMNVYATQRLIQLRGYLTVLGLSGENELHVWMLKNLNDWNSWQKLFYFNPGDHLYWGLSVTGKYLLNIQGQIKLVELSCETLNLFWNAVYLDGGYITDSIGYTESLVSPFVLKPDLDRGCRLDYRGCTEILVLPFLDEDEEND